MIRADGRTSWFSDTTTASGDHTTPGIAVANSHTLGGFWWVRMPNGRSPILKQIDWGPNPAVNRTVDVHENAFGAVGYNGGNFPTDSHVQAVFLGRGKNHAARQAARLGLRVTPGGAVNGVVAGVRKGMEQAASPTPSTLGAAVYPQSSTDTASAGLSHAMAGIPSTVLQQPPVNAQSGLAVALRRARLIV